MSDNGRVPFTLAHGSAVLPFRGSRLVFPALLVGSFSPDFEYFLRLTPEGRFGHTLLGAFVLDLPLALLVLWLFYSFVKLPLLKLLPDAVMRRLVDHLHEFHFGGAARLALIASSALAGVMTHLAWDSLTHPNTWPYRHWRVFAQPVNLPIVGLLPFYKVLQHGSTIIGLSIFATWLAAWYRGCELSGQDLRNLLSPMQKVGISAAVLSVAAAGAITRAILVVGVPAGHPAERRFVGVLVVAVVALVWWQLLAYGIFLSRENQHPQDGPTHDAPGV